MTPSLYEPGEVAAVSDYWVRVKDGNRTAGRIFGRHYTCKRPRTFGNYARFAGNGETLVLLTPAEDALFVWRLERYRDDGQTGINCAVFRNEGPTLSSLLIQEAVKVAWWKWPGERLFTFVDAEQTRRKRDPGRCYLRAGWTPAGTSKKGLLIFELLPVTQSL